MDMIAVIMGAPDSKTRFKEATTLLNYGFAKCSKYVDEGLEQLEPASVQNGVADSVPIEQEAFEYIDTEGRELLQIEKKAVIENKLKAPIKKGAVVGEMEYYIGEEKLGSTPIIATQDVEKMNYKAALEEALDTLFL